MIGWNNRVTFVGQQHHFLPHNGSMNRSQSKPSGSCPAKPGTFRKPPNAAIMERNYPLDISSDLVYVLGNENEQRKSEHNDSRIS